MNEPKTWTDEIFFNILIWNHSTCNSKWNYFSIEFLCVTKNWLLSFYIAKRNIFDFKELRRATARSGMVFILRMLLLKLSINAHRLLFVRLESTLFGSCIHFECFPVSVFLFSIMYCIAPNEAWHFIARIEHPNTPRIHGYV